MLGEELRPGLRTWTAYHEEWEKHVRGFAIVESERVILIDPLLAGDQWDELAAMRGQSGLDVLLTIHWHARSAAEIREHHPDATVWGFAPDREEIEKRTPIDRAFEAGDGLPGGLVPIAAPPRHEVVLWDPAHAALIAGDVLLGDGEEGEGLHLAPESWLGGEGSHETLRAALAPVLDLPVELVLTAHGEMVLGNAPAALRDARAAQDGRCPGRPARPRLVLGVSWRSWQAVTAMRRPGREGFVKHPAQGREGSDLRDGPAREMPRLARIV